MKRATSQPKKVLGVSRNVFFLGWVSFLTDVSSEMIFNVLPLFLSNVLGLGTAFIGLIEGLGDSAATILKIASGWFSDRIGKRKGVTTAGYVLSTLAKPFLYVASAGWVVLIIRVAERSGKGSGRVYTLVWTATDASGNSTTETQTVTVPKSKKKKKKK